MPQLNYHHLWHFSVVAREGGLRAAASSEMISASTLSEQIKALEQQMGGELFERVGRKMHLTDLGRHVHNYAESIFRTGNELLDSIQHGQFELRVPLRVGVVNAMPKVIAYHLLAPLFTTDPVTELTVMEDEMPRLLAALASDKMDVVLSDSPIPPNQAIRLYNHLLGESRLGIFVSKQHKKNHEQKAFPKSLDGQAFLMPTDTTVLYRELTRWFEQHQIEPSIQSRFENSSLLKLFASRGHGAFAAPVVARAYMEKQYACLLLGEMTGVHEQYYAITSDRKIKHPGVRLIQETAKDFMKSIV